MSQLGRKQNLFADSEIPSFFGLAGRFTRLSGENISQNSLESLY